MTILEIEKKANVIRQDLMRMLLEAGSGHSAGPLGMADIFAALYFDVLKHDPKHNFVQHQVLNTRLLSRKR